MKFKFTKFKFLLSAMLLLLGLAGYSQQIKKIYESEPGVTIDDAVFRHIDQEAHKLMEHKHPERFATLATQLANDHVDLKLLESFQNKVEASEIFKTNASGVLVVATIYKCDDCPNTHLRAASGFVIAEEGIAVTSYHIFKGDATDENSDLAVVVMDYEGRVYPVKEVLAASFNDDVAIFRFDVMGGTTSSLPLGQDAIPGQNVSIISHPHSMFYSFTSGVAIRSYLRNEAKKTSVTADFSQGSSGAPVFDDKGNVVGVVSATRALYNTDQNVQMVSREVIPVSRLKTLIN
ncbi:S1-C subfamily serine protease [Algoriphagus sp. 4150]|uniref:S1 family peptidase n=1 Tax=Algoriphagus sp. 4150 TaxID=2817756 RepID=UPI0028599060|nr:serine protease [Algoriphagus sp. 4150]MDR7131938.1 S1-C subfamily serine protease [Algoriphagus sp. 4150]